MAINTDLELAQVVNIAMLNRTDLPVAVPERLYQEARAQMENLMRERGFPVPTSGMLQKRRVEHFMVNGVVVVPE